MVNGTIFKGGKILHCSSEYRPSSVELYPTWQIATVSKAMPPNAGSL